MTHSAYLMFHFHAIKWSITSCFFMALGSEPNYKVHGSVMSCLSKRLDQWFFTRILIIKWRTLNLFIFLSQAYTLNDFTVFVFVTQNIIVGLEHK